MNNIKKLLGIFESYTHGQILEGINEGKMYLQYGSENFPIDFSDSIGLLNDLEKIFIGIVLTPQKYELAEEREIFGYEQLLDCRAGIPLQGGSEELKKLRAEMRMIMTDDNLEQYLRVMGFVETLINIYEK